MNSHRLYLDEFRATRPQPPKVYVAQSGLRLWIQDDGRLVGEIRSFPSAEVAVSRVGPLRPYLPELATPREMTGRLRQQLLRLARWASVETDPDKLSWIASLARRIAPGSASDVRIISHLQYLHDDAEAWPDSVARRLAVMIPANHHHSPQPVRVMRAPQLPQHLHAPAPSVANPWTSVPLAQYVRHLSYTPPASARKAAAPNPHPGSGAADVTAPSVARIASVPDPLEPVLTDPKFARDTPNGRYYEDPSDLQLVPSITNCLEEWAINALAPGAAKETAEWFMDNLPAAMRASLDPDKRAEFLKTAKGQYRVAWDKKMELGSRIHHMADAHNLGAPIPDDEEAAPYLEQYLKFLDDFGVDWATDIVSSERTVLRRSEPRYGGTSDLNINLRFPTEYSPQHPRYRGRKESTSQPIHTPSGLWLVDIKTSTTKPASAVYRDNVLQLSGLRYADVALLPDDTEVEVPEYVGAAILNLRKDSYGFVPLPADRAAHQAFLSIVPLARFAHALDMTPHKPVAAPTRTLKKGAA